MYVFERAAELKAKSERAVVVGTTASVRTVYYISVTTYKMVYDTVAKAFQERKPQKERKYRVGARRGQHQPTDLAHLGDDDKNTTFLQPTPSNPASNTSNSSIIPTSTAQLNADQQLQEQFRLFQQMLLAQQQSSTSTTLPSSSNTSSSTTASQLQSVPKLQVKSGNIPPPPYLPGFLDSNGELIPIPTRLTSSNTATTTSAAKPPASKPKPAVSGGIDLSELTRRPLRKVNRDNNLGDNKDNIAPQLNNTNSGNENIQPRPLLGLDGPHPPQLIVRGKRVESSNIPGEESMSFSDRIKVASKMTLRQTQGQRSPGGTPHRDRKEEEPEFVLALRKKFKNVNRESLDESNDSEAEW